MTVENLHLLDVRQLVLDAERRSREHLVETPLEYSHSFSRQIGAEVWLKLDCMQRTGSFKFRGAVNKILSLTDEELDRGVVTASTGNYALAVAEAMRIRDRRATVYVASNIAPARLELIKEQGLDVVVHGEDCWHAETESCRVADEEGKVYVSPYNDPVVVGGQGTCGLEISRQLPDVEAAFFACGGGGLISGSGGWLKNFNPEIEIVAVSPENSPVMCESLKADRVIEMESKPTLADTCAGGIDLDTVTFPLCRKYVDEFVLLEEEAIEQAMRMLFEEHRLVTEGSGALCLGGLLKLKERFKGKRVVLVVCGRNIGTELFKRIIA